METVGGGKSGGFSAVVQDIQQELRGHLGASSSPVERDIAMLLKLDGKPDEAEGFRIRRYHRKMDVARKVMAAYDEQIQMPIGEQVLSAQGYLGLALVFAKASCFEDRRDEASKARALGWLNSAFNSLDCVKAPGFAESVRIELHSMLREACVR